MTEEDVLSTFQTCLNHPNLEVMQIVERIEIDDENAKGKMDDKKSMNKLQIIRGIQANLQDNSSLKKLEIRYFQMSR